MLRRQVPFAALHLVPRRRVVVGLVPRRQVVAGLLCAAVSASCATLGGRPPEDEPLPVKAVEEPIVVAAWAEPRQLPPGGGQAQILVRIQKPGGRRFPGVEVRLRASPGSLYSDGRVLLTDAEGMTRDQLTTRKTTVITLNAGGTRYRFQVPVAPAP
jgi:hypothetical protein